MRPLKYSPVGKVRLIALAGLFTVNLVVLTLSARVNIFQEFFFMADLFPLVLSVVTLVILVGTTVLDLGVRNAFTSRPLFHIGMLSVLTIFWLAFNAFSTARWRFVPLRCGGIPADFADERVWCRELQALKAFVWIEWVILFSTMAITIRYVVTQHAQGNKHIWSMPLSRYLPVSGASGTAVNGRDPFGNESSFWQEKSFGNLEMVK